MQELILQLPDQRFFTGPKDDGELTPMLGSLNDADHFFMMLRLAADWISLARIPCDEKGLAPTTAKILMPLITVAAG